MIIDKVLFARIGWMKRYKGSTDDDPRPVGGGAYNKNDIGHELCNFQPIDGNVYGYFQPQMRADSIDIERISPGTSADVLHGVLLVFIATDKNRGGQRIVGFYKNATVHRHAQQSKAAGRNRFSFYAQTTKENAFLVPEPSREFVLPGGKKGKPGQANIFYVINNGKARGEKWISDAIDYVLTYKKENIVETPTSEGDSEIAEVLSSTVDRVAGFQSNPAIRRAIELYAMDWAMKRLSEEGLSPVDTHVGNPYDIIGTAGGGKLFIEVKGTQDEGTAVSLTPREVDHATKNKNCALFVVHSVKVQGKRSPKISGGKEIFIRQWDISSGTLTPRSFIYELPASALLTSKKKSAG